MLDSEVGLDALITPVLTIIVMLIGFSIMLRGLRSRDPDAARRVNMEIRSLSGGNMAMVLATLALARLVYEFSLRSGTEIGMPVLVVGGFGVVVGVALWRRLFAPLLSLLGLVAFWIHTFLLDGMFLGLTLVIVSIAMLMALGIARILSPG